MEAQLEAKQSAKFEAVEAFLQAQCQEMTAIRELQLTQRSISIPSPSRKKPKPNTSMMNSPSSSHPDGADQDEDDDIAQLRNQSQENMPTTTSNVHQPTPLLSFRPNDPPDQVTHQDDDPRHVSPPLIRPDGTPDQGDYQGDDMDHESL